MLGTASNAAVGKPGVDLRFIVFALLLRGIGVIASIIGNQLVRTDERRRNAMAAMNRGYYVAAVIAVAHPKWAERPLACVVLKPGASVDADGLRAHLAPSFARWQLPDAFEFVEAIPRTSTGKFWKAKLRERFADYRLPD